MRGILTCWPSRVQVVCGLVVVAVLFLVVCCFFGKTPGVATFSKQGTDIKTSSARLVAVKAVTNENQIAMEERGTRKETVSTNKSVVMVTVASKKQRMAQLRESIRKQSEGK